VPGSEGTWTVHLPSGEEMTVFDASQRYLAEDVPLVVLAGKEYGSGSSRDWAAKGPNLLGVRAVIAESYERIHRSNLLMMGILPLQFAEGESAESLGLSGHEEFAAPRPGEARHAAGARLLPPRRHPAVRAAAATGRLRPRPRRARRALLRASPRGRRSARGASAAQPRFALRR